MVRRQKIKEPKKPFEAAFAAIDRMEMRVCYNIVTVPFTLRQFVDWYYPEKMVDALVAAYQYSGGINPNVRISLKLVDGSTGKFSLLLDPDKVPMCSPKDVQSQGVYDTCGVINTLFAFKSIHEQWNVVRKVARWLNDYASVGCARHYFPALGNFLPPEHAFHKLDGQIFKPPLVPISGISNDIRTAAETVAAGVLCPPVKDGEKIAGLWLQIIDDGGIRSQSFILV